MNECTKICWDLLELNEKQAELIQKLTLRVKELEAFLDFEGEVIQYKEGC